MDNSFIAQANIPEEIDNKEVLRQREAELVKIIEALGQVVTSENWRVLQELYFGKIEDGLARRLMNEAKASDINAPALYRLQGQLSWARQYANLDELRNNLKVELKNIRNQING